jgi:hypothetical protein
MHILRRQRSIAPPGPLPCSFAARLRQIQGQSMDALCAERFNPLFNSLNASIDHNFIIGNGGGILKGSSPVLAANSLAKTRQKLCFP